MTRHKFLVLFMIFLLLLPLAACRQSVDTPDVNDPENDEDPMDAKDPPDDDPEPGPPDRTTLAGIALGDPAAEVTRLFGTMHTEEMYLEDEGYYGENVKFWNYQDRIYFTIGQSTQKVLRIDVSVSDYQTSLGTRIGQRAEDVLPVYRDLYDELVSIHTDEVVPGWFLVEDGGLLIFFFNDGDEPLFGVPIPESAVIEGITLAYGHHFD